jgi:hypothetical protein
MDQAARNRRIDVFFTGIASSSFQNPTGWAHLGLLALALVVVRKRYARTGGESTDLNLILRHDQVWCGGCRSQGPIGWSEKRFSFSLILHCTRLFREISERKYCRYVLPSRIQSVTAECRSLCDSTMLPEIILSGCHRDESALRLRALPAEHRYRTRGRKWCRLPASIRRTARFSRPPVLQNGSMIDRCKLPGVVDDAMNTTSADRTEWSAAGTFEWCQESGARVLGRGS